MKEELTIQVQDEENLRDFSAEVPKETNMGVLTVERICTITAVTSHKRPCDRRWV
jgi:hypothetical protein